MAKQSQGKNPLAHHWRIPSLEQWHQDGVDGQFFAAVNMAIARGGHRQYNSA